MAGQTILVVDDDMSTRSLLQLSLEQAGYTVFIAENGQEALEKVLAMPPDIILSDVVMPKMTGFELCHELKQNSFTCSIPIMLLTSQRETQDVIQGFQEGADEYITKPFDVKEVLVRVERVLRWTNQKKDGLPEITGSLEKMPMFKLLHFCEEHRISGIIHLRGWEKEGDQKFELKSKIHLKLGEIVSIELKDITEVVEALDELLEWTDGTFMVEQEELQLPADGSGQPLTILEEKSNIGVPSKILAEKHADSDTAPQLAHFQPLLQRIQTELDAAGTVTFIVMDSSVMDSNVAGVESSEVGGMITELMELSENACQVSGKGRVTGCTIKGDQGVIALYPAGRGVTLTISVPSESNLGFINLVGGQFAQEVEDLLK